MTAPAFTFEQAPLRLYIAYDSLPAQQAATIIYHVATAYDVVMTLFPPISTLLRYRFWDPEFWPHGPPLGVESAATGESIKIGFGPPRHLLPRFRFEGQDLEVLLPRWTAAAILAGAVLTGGLTVANKYLEFQRNRLELEQLRNATDSMRPPDATTADALKSIYDQFQDTISTPNIRTITINDFAARPDNTRTQRRR